MNSVDQEFKTNSKWKLWISISYLTRDIINRCSETWRTVQTSASSHCINFISKGMSLVSKDDPDRGETILEEGLLLFASWPWSEPSWWSFREIGSGQKGMTWANSLIILLVLEIITSTLFLNTADFSPCKLPSCMILAHCDATCKRTWLICLSCSTFFWSPKSRGTASHRFRTLFTQSYSRKGWGTGMESGRGAPKPIETFKL